MRIDRIRLGVGDVEVAAAWYTSVLGLQRLAGPGDGADLACGSRSTPDLELRAGGGLLALVFRTVGRAELEARRAALEVAGLAVEDLGADALATALPNGARVELFAAGDDRYVHTTEWAGDAVASPRQIDHVTTTATDVDPVIEAATQGLGLRVSDYQRAHDRNVGAWLRAGERHHDFAVARGRQGGLHHLAYQVADAAALITLADRVVRLGYRAEYGIGRHGPGSNLFLYVRDPSGNRVELCCDMAVIPEGAPARIWEGGDDRYLDVWAPYLPPPSWAEVT